MTAPPGLVDTIPDASSLATAQRGAGSLAARILRHSLQSPHRAAISVDAHSLDYAELVQRARAVMQSWPVPPATAAGKAAGVLSEPLVALAAPNHVAFAVIYLACVASGTTLALLDPGWSQRHRRQLLDPFEPHSQFDAGACTRLFEVTTGSAETVSHPDDWLAAWVQSHTEAAEAQFDNTRFLLGFTSGSSGRPKAFVRRQRSWRLSLDASQREFGISAGDCVIAPGPLSHGLSFFAMVDALSAGASFQSQSRFDATQLLALLQSRDASTVVLVPTMLHRLLTCAAAPLEQVQRIVTAGAKLPPSMLNKARAAFPRAIISEYYGASELSFVSVKHHLPGHPVDSSVHGSDSVGRAFHGVELSIRSDDGQACDTGTTGVVSVNSEMLAEGYIELITDRCELRPLSTLAGAANVGDVGYLDASGQLFLTGRRDRIINTGALKVSAERIEAVFDDIALPGALVVFGKPSTEWGQLVAIALEADPAGVATTDIDSLAARINAAAQERLQRHEWPRYLVLCPSLPRTLSGKLCFAEVWDTVITSGGELHPLMTDAEVGSSR